MELRGKQKRFLRSQAHHLQPIFQIGKSGLGTEMLKQMAEALERRELIKISLLQNTELTAEEAASEIRSQIGCEVVQIIGHVLVLFKVSSKEKYRKISQEVKAI